MSILNQGSRYVYQNGHYDWVHPLEVAPSAVDCTDMSDAEFEAQVARTHGLERASAGGK